MRSIFRNQQLLAGFLIFGALLVSNSFGQGDNIVYDNQALEDWSLPANSPPPILCVAKIDGDRLYYHTLNAFTKTPRGFERRGESRGPGETKYYAELYSCPLDQVSVMRQDEHKIRTFSDQSQLGQMAREHFEEGFKRALLITESKSISEHYAKFYDQDLFIICVPNHDPKTKK